MLAWGLWHPRHGQPDPALQTPGAVLVSGEQDRLTAQVPEGLRVLTPAQAQGAFEARLAPPDKIGRP
jgi:hypothetical protein